LEGKQAKEKSGGHRAARYENKENNEVFFDFDREGVPLCMGWTKSRGGSNSTEVQNAERKFQDFEKELLIFRRSLNRGIQIIKTKEGN